MNEEKDAQPLSIYRRDETARGDAEHPTAQPDELSALLKSWRVPETPHALDQRMMDAYHQEMEGAHTRKKSLAEYIPFLSNTNR
jgi:hypothetical protein